MNNLTKVLAKSTKVMVTKTITTNTQLTYTPIIDSIGKYSNALTHQAKKSKGYIHSQSYWDLTNSNRIITLSYWDDINDWNNWQESENRKNIHTRFDYLEIDATISHLIPKILYKDTALL